jgi:hypothetical protein
MYEQIINSAFSFAVPKVIDLSIVVMEGFLAFYLLAEMLPNIEEGGKAFEDSGYDEHLNDDYYCQQVIADKRLSAKQLQKIAKDNGVPGWSRMKKEDLSRELYNCALL